MGSFLSSKLWTNDELQRKFPAILTGNDILLAVRCVGLCLLSYYNKCLKTKYLEFEDKWVKSLAVHDLRFWNERVSVDVASKTLVPSQALTGYIRNLDEDAMGNIPFICFRGTKAVDDIVRDLKSFDVAPMKLRGRNHHTYQSSASKGPKTHSTGTSGSSAHNHTHYGSNNNTENSINNKANNINNYKRSNSIISTTSVISNGSTGRSTSFLYRFCRFCGCCCCFTHRCFRRRRKRVGLTGGHFYDKLGIYLKMGILEDVVTNVEKFRNGLIICGHGIGAAVANLFFVELLYNYPDLVAHYKDRIRLVTFGEPRCFNKSLAKRLQRVPIKKLRFINENDLVTGLPCSEHRIFRHFGKAFYAKRLTKQWHSLDGFDDFGWDHSEAQLRRMTELKRVPSFSNAPPLLRRGSSSVRMGMYSDGSGSGSMRGFECFAEDMRPHTLASDYGYLRQLVNSTEYSNAVKSLHEPRVKKLYLGLPIDYEELDEFEDDDGDVCDVAEPEAIARDDT